MTRRGTIRLTMCVVLVCMAGARGADAQDTTTSSSRTGGLRALGPLTAMSAEEQTRLALSSAPPEVSSRASVYVLGAAGYTRTRVGTNGFSCLIEREFLETVEPVCYDAEGSATTLRARLYREELRSQGVPEAAIERRIEAAYRARRFRAPRKPGLVYMLAPEQRSWNPGTKSIFQAGPHFMLYAPFATQADVGGPLGPHMPVVVWPGRPDALIILMAPRDTHGR